MKKLLTISLLLFSSRLYAQAAITCKNMKGEGGQIVTGEMGDYALRKGKDLGDLFKFIDKIPTYTDKYKDDVADFKMNPLSGEMITDHFEKLEAIHCGRAVLIGYLGLVANSAKANANEKIKIHDKLLKFAKHPDLQMPSLLEFLVYTRVMQRALEFKILSLSSEDKARLDKLSASAEALKAKVIQEDALLKNWNAFEKIKDDKTATQEQKNKLLADIRAATVNEYESVAKMQVEAASYAWK